MAISANQEGDRVVPLPLAMTKLPVAAGFSLRWSDATIEPFHWNKPTMGSSQHGLKPVATFWDILDEG
mgnify:CR=1 FL=1